MKVENENVISRHSGSEATGPVDGPGERHRSHLWIFLLILVVAVLLVVFGILPRIQARTALRQETLRMAVPTVAVVQPKRSAPAQEIVLPANVQAFADAPIYARTNGYLKRWYVDIGSRVKQGQLLADIDTPEVNQQLRQARADLGTSQANLNLSKITADRYQGLLKTDSVNYSQKVRKYLSRLELLDEDELRRTVNDNSVLISILKQKEHFKDLASRSCVREPRN